MQYITCVTLSTQPGIYKFSIIISFNYYLSHHFYGTVSDLYQPLVSITYHLCNVWFLKNTLIMTIKFKLAFRYMANPILYCKVKKLNILKKEVTSSLILLKN